MDFNLFMKKVQTKESLNTSPWFIAPLLTPTVPECMNYEVSVCVCARLVHFRVHSLTHRSNYSGHYYYLYSTVGECSV